MKLVLIQPPIQDFYDTDIRLQPIGLVWLFYQVWNQLEWIGTQKNKRITTSVL